MAVTTIRAHVSACSSSRNMGPCEVLQLAILGVIAPAPAPLEDLIDMARSLGGEFWCPTVEVIATSLSAMETQGLLKIESVPVAASDTVIRLTGKGADHLAGLLRRSTNEMPEPLFHCVLGIKIALLDVLAPAERRNQITDMVDRLETARQTLRGKMNLMNRCPKRKRQLYSVVEFAETRLATEIKWLTELRDASASVPDMEA